jgi:predicted dehydrogenase
VLALDVDLVILASPPGFRPDQILAAANAGKHIFAEKPVAVDPIGIRKVLEAGKILEAKKKGFVTGTQRRHQKPYVEMMKAIADGVIGDVVTCSVYWNQGALWKKDRDSDDDATSNGRPETGSTSRGFRGDHIVEQHVHNLDVMCWAMGGPPAKCTSLGGRQVRTDPSYGAHLRSLRGRLRMGRRSSRVVVLASDRRFGGARR